MKEVDPQGGAVAVDTAALDTVKEIMNSTQGSTQDDVMMKDGEGEIFSTARTSFVEVC